MDLHADLSQRSLHDSNAVVPYAPRCRFEPHVHGGGKEILVLEGTFSDEHVDFPAGSWLRNPPGSGHRFWREEGSTISVKIGHLPATQRPDGLKSMSPVIAERPAPQRSTLAPEQPSDGGSGQSGRSHPGAGGRSWRCRDR